MTVCKNCDNQFEGNYCNNCGQTADTHRFSLKHIFHEAVHTFTHADKGLLKLIPDLFTKPGETVRNYIAGQRKKYFNPIQYLLIVTAIIMFVMIQFHMMESSMSAPVGNLSARQLYFQQFNMFIYKYFNVIIFLSIPLFALITWFFFRRSGYNYAENLIMQIFYSAQRSIIFIFLVTPMVILFRPYLFPIMAGYHLLWNLYFFWAISQFFQIKTFFGYVKVLFSIIVFYVVLHTLMFYVFDIFFYKP
jgi:hypothetical protein